MPSRNGHRNDVNIYNEDGFFKNDPDRSIYEHEIRKNKAAWKVLTILRGILGVPDGESIIEHARKMTGKQEANV